MGNTSNIQKNNMLCDRSRLLGRQCLNCTSNIRRYLHVICMQGLGKLTDKRAVGKIQVPKGCLERAVGAYIKNKINECSEYSIGVYLSACLLFVLIFFITCASMLCNNWLQCFLL